jgi:16S rRNA (cytosine1402-N4)-methyltransferase
MQSIHEPVLLHEIIANFSVLSDRASGLDSIKASSRAKSTQKTFWYFDGTLGGAGHALAIAKAFEGKLGIIGLDRDAEALTRAKVTLKDKSEKLILEHDNFRNIDKVLERNGIDSVDLILLDLGLSSDELDNSGRGFTFQKDEPLLMTMGDPKDYPFTAKDIVNKWDEDVIADIIYGYAEEKFARRIARTIVNYRIKKQIETSGELAELVKMSVPGFYKRGKIHPATKTFQALRIAVNDELGSLKEGLRKGYERLGSGGRVAVISFHSLEDRIVKEFFKEKVGVNLKKIDQYEEKVSKEKGINNEKEIRRKIENTVLSGEGKAKIITKKPITASMQEIAENPRSRSAKLRIIEKI